MWSVPEGNPQGLACPPRDLHSVTHRIEASTRQSGNWGLPGGSDRVVVARDVAQHEALKLVRNLGPPPQDEHHLLVGFLIVATGADTTAGKVVIAIYGRVVLVIEPPTRQSALCEASISA